MTKYKVGDVAALFSKPKNPTTTAGKKLQSLFEDFYNKKSKPDFHSQTEENSVRITENVEISDLSVSNKGKKRKFSCFNDSESNQNVSLKKFKDSSEQEDGSNYNENKKFKKQKNFQKKNYNENDLFKKKFKASSEQVENSKNNESKKFKQQQDFPRKNKQFKVNSFNTSSTFPKFETEKVSENDVELPFVSKLQNMPKENKQNKNFIKKSKKQNFNNNSSKLSNDLDCKDSNDSDDDSLRKQIKEFMNNNSAEEEMESSHGNIKREKFSNSKGQNAMGKPKKKHLTNEISSPKKQEESSKHAVKSKKMKQKFNNTQQDFLRIDKESKANSFNFGNTGSEIKYDGGRQNGVKKSKKFKHGLNNEFADSFVAVKNNPEINNPKDNKVADFIRKPKNKKVEHDTLDKDNFKKSNSNALGGWNTDKNFQSKEWNVNSKMQKQQVKGYGEETDFIKLPSSYEENYEKFCEERLSRTLFVGNLPKSTSKQELKNLFSRFGITENVRLVGVETDKAKVFGKNPPKLLHSNYVSDTIPGFIVFKDKESAVQALSLSGSVFKGHHITVDFAVPAGTHKLYDNKRSVFIGNLPFDVKDESVWNAFSQCGRIEGVRVVRDRKTGLGKGFGYVLFSTAEAKANALALESLHIEEREIRIKAVDSNKKAQKSDSPSPAKRDSFKSRAIRLKKNSNDTSGRKSIRKLTNKQKNLHKKKKIASIMQKAMK